MTKILHISEEYGYGSWYAILSDLRYEELKEEWATIKGLNCLVPVRFLIPEASSFPLKEEDEKYGELEYLQNNNVEIVGCHIHQSDDSWLEGVSPKVPEAQEFEFKGKTYSEKLVHDIFNKYRNEEIKEYEEREKKNPEFDNGTYPPDAWNKLDNSGVVRMEVEWVEKIEEE